MYPFLLALYGALCWGIAPLFGKAGMRGVNPTEALAARTLVTVFFVFGWLFARGDVSQLRSIPPKRWILLGIEAFLATFAGDLAYYAALKFGDIGQTALVLSAAPLVTIWMGHWFLGEQITLYKMIGAVLIVGGVIFVGLDAVQLRI